MNKIVIILSLFIASACNRTSPDLAELKAQDESVDLKEVTALSSPIPVKSEIKFTPPVIKSDEEDVSGSSEDPELKPVVKADKKKIIKDGSLTLKTKDVEKSHASVNSLVKKLDGYYDQESLNNDNSVISYDLKIRIPSDKFESLLNELEHGGDEIISKKI